MAFTDIRGMNKKYMRALKRFSRISPVELYDLDRTILEFITPRLDAYNQMSSVLSGVTKERSSKLKRLVELGNKILERKKTTKNIEIINDLITCIDNQLNFTVLTEEQIEEALKEINIDIKLRAEFKVLFSELLFTLTL